MGRLPAATVIALLGTAITLAPVGAWADNATTTAPVSTTTGIAEPASTAPATVAATAVEPTTVEPTTAPASTTTAPASTTSRPAARHSAANAHASTNHLIKVSSNCTYFCFAPMTVTIALGDTVTWSNTSGAAHTVKRCNPAACEGKSGGTGTDTNFGAADVGLPVGKSFQFTFDQPGTYVYFCTPHGYSVMHGTITVAAATPTTTIPVIVSDPTVPTTSVTTAFIGPHLASTGGRTNGMLTVALITLTLGLAAASAGLRRER